MSLPFEVGVYPTVLGDSLGLALIFVAVAIGILLWGFERYRTTFSKVELGIAIALSAGILTLGLFPDIFRTIEELLNISSTFRAIQILVNIALLGLVLFLISMIYNNRTRMDQLTRNLTIQQAPIAEQTLEQTILVVIPAHNEAGNIGQVLAGLPETVKGYAVQALVISDGSDDETAEVARDHGAMVAEHPLNQGQGGALKTGFAIANRQGADIIVTMDADGQHPPEQLVDLVTPIIDDEADYVHGSRYRGEDASGNPLFRRVGIRVFTWLINVLTKSKITDCTNGFRAFRGSSLPQLTLTEERFSAPELIIEARKNGLRLREVPVTVLERGTGESKKPKLGYAVGLARTILITWIR